MSNNTFSNTRIGTMLKEARESGDERLETRALYIWGCRQWRKMENAKPYMRYMKVALREFNHAETNFDNLPSAIKRAVRRTYGH